MSLLWGGVFCVFFLYLFIWYRNMFANIWPSILQSIISHNTLACFQFRRVCFYMNCKRHCDVLVETGEVRYCQTSGTKLCKTMFLSNRIFVHNRSLRATPKNFPTWILFSLSHTHTQALSPVFVCRISFTIDSFELSAPNYFQLLLQIR